MSAIKNILIIGGGISGLTAATAIRQRLPEVAVELVEINPEITDMGGVGLSVLGNALKALATLGLAQQCVAAGMPSIELMMRTPAGDVAAELKLPALGEPDWPNQVGISRAVFHRILLDAAVAAGTHIRCGLTVTDIDQDKAGSRVQFTDGSAASYDLVVAADGLYSATRSKFFPQAPQPFSLGLGIWRAYAVRPADVRTTQLYLGGAQGLVGICPISENDCYIYCMHEATPGQRRDPATFASQLREKLTDYDCPRIKTIVEHMTDPTLVNYRPLEGIFMESDWYQGRVLLIGDASHIGPPNLAQGAAMGIEDGVVLADELQQGGSVVEVLARFMARRYARAKVVFDTSYQIARAEGEQDKRFDVAAAMARANEVIAQAY